MSHRSTIWMILLLAVLAVSACTVQPTVPATPTVTPIPTFTATPDPCQPPALQESIAETDRLMREFDDGSLLAQNTPRDLLLDPISDLQRIRRAAEDQEIPACLYDLKSYQLAHMNTVIDILIGFLKEADAEAVNEAAAQARQLHDQYTIEMARLLGVTLVAPAIETGTPAPEGTGTPAP
jgi:hypothetical protein